MERSTSIDKVYGQKPYLIRYQNDSVIFIANNNELIHLD